MNLNLLKVQSSTSTSALKILAEGTGSMSTAAGNNVSASATIAHNYASDLLLWQVSLNDGSTGQTYITPYFSGDSRYNLYAELDATNLYIKVDLTSAGSPYPAITWAYNYRILIP